MEIDVIGTVVSPNAVRAPISGEDAAAVHIEGVRDGAILATTILGDLLRIRFDDGAELEIVVRRATLMFTTRFDDPAPWPTPVPAELVPLLQRGVTGLRERLVRSGDRFRVRGVVEAAQAQSRFVAAETIRLDESLAFD